MTTDGGEGGRAEERGRGERSTWVLAAAVVAVVLVAALLGGRTTDGRQDGDTDVLDVRTADPESLPLPEVVNPPTASPTPTPTPTPSPTESVAGGTASTPTPSAPPTPLVPTATGVRVHAAVAGFGRRGPELSVVRIEPATGTVTEADVPFDENFADTIAPFGDGIVVVTDGQARALSPSLAVTDVLGPAEAVMGSTTGSTVWLLDSHPSNTLDDVTVRAMDAGGGESAPVRLPAYARPAGATREGLVVQAGQRALLVTPAGRLRGMAEGRIVAVEDEAVAVLRCAGALPCSVRVVDHSGTGGHEAAAPSTMPDPAAPYLLARLSPDHRRLAFVDTGDDGRLRILDLATGGSRIVPVPSLTRLAAGVAWTPDSAAVVVSAAGGIVWWPVDGGDAVRLVAPDGQVFSVLAGGAA